MKIRRHCSRAIGATDMGMEDLIQEDCTHFVDVRPSEKGCDWTTFSIMVRRFDTTSRIFSICWE